MERDHNTVDAALAEGDRVQHPAISDVSHEAEHRAELAAASRALPIVLAIGSVAGAASMIAVPTPYLWANIGFWVIDALILGWAVASWKLRYRYTDRSLSMVLLICLAIVGIGVYAEHNAASASVMAYIWLALFGFQFLSGRWATLMGVATVAVAGVQFAVTQPHDDSVYRWIMVACTVAAIGVMLRVSKRRIGALVVQLSNAARTDWLTGLQNRRAFDGVLQVEMNRSHRHSQPVSLLLLDIDHFKNVNDLYGHEAGDEVLKQVAGILNGGRRGHDATGRMGGEEFAVLLPNTALDGAQVVAERIRARIERHFAGRQPSVTISIGVAQMRAETLSTQDLLRDADRALYSAKAFGRNQVVTFSSESALRMMDSIRAQTTADGPEVGLMLALLDTLTSLGHHSGGRADRVGMWCQDVALELGMHADEAQQVRLAGIFGDVGKLVLPRDILLADRKLTGEELDQVRHQSKVSADLVSAIGFEGIAEWIRHQYERWDGSGYPDGRAGDEIPLASRIVAVVAAFEAMVTDRPHSPALSRPRALAELRRAAGSQFDGEVVEAFADVLAVDMGVGSEHRDGGSTVNTR